MIRFKRVSVRIIAVLGVALVTLFLTSSFLSYSKAKNKTEKLLLHEQEKILGELINEAIDRMVKGADSQV